jgi:hypothetical protein
VQPLRLGADLRAAVVPTSLPEAVEHDRARVLLELFGGPDHKRQRQQRLELARRD